MNAGEREVEATPSEGFVLLRTLGLDRSLVREPVAEVLDLIAVTASGAVPYVCANGVIAGRWAATRVWRRRPLVAVMGERTLRERATSLAVANGQFATGDRWLAPRAHPGDGRLAVLIDANAVWRARAVDRRMILGEHVPDRRIHQLRPLTLEVDGPPWPLRADGVAGQGHLPARFDVVPGALTLWV